MLYDIFVYSPENWQWHGRSEGYWEKRFFFALQSVNHPQVVYLSEFFFDDIEEEEYQKLYHIWVTECVNYWLSHYVTRESKVVGTARMGSMSWDPNLRALRGRVKLAPAHVKGMTMIWDDPYRVHPWNWNYN